MDDFGSEYSTLNLLQELDFDLVKIDMRFMRNMAEGEKNHIIIANMIRMLRELGEGTLMEGVETEDQYRLLKEMGCGLLQGYYFSRPVSFDQIVETVSGGNSPGFEPAEEETP